MTNVQLVLIKELHLEFLIAHNILYETYNHNLLSLWFVKKKDIIMFEHCTLVEMITLMTFLKSKPLDKQMIQCAVMRYTTLNKAIWKS